MNTPDVVMAGNLENSVMQNCEYYAVGVSSTVDFVINTQYIFNNIVSWSMKGKRIATSLDFGKAANLLFLSCFLYFYR